MTEFEKKCYQAYQLDWMIQHGISLDDAFKVMLFCVADATDTDGEIDMMEARETFECNVGFDGIIYSSPQEFLENEMLDREYMRDLVKRIPGDNIAGEYEEYIATREIVEQIEAKWCA